MARALLDASHMATVLEVILLVGFSLTLAMAFATVVTHLAYQMRDDLKRSHGRARDPFPNLSGISAPSRR